MADRLKKGQTASVKVLEKVDKAVIQKLAEKAKWGDSDALYSLCQAIAKSVLFRMSCKLSQMDAEDATQDVLFKVCSNIHNLREPKAVSGWLNSIIMQEMGRYLKSNAKQADIVSMDDYLDSLVEENDEFLPGEYIIKEDDRKAVMEIVKQLPERQSEAVLLHYYEGMSITETAEAMNVVRPTVNRYLVLARDKIKKGLQKQAKGTNTLYGLSLLPIGGLLARVFHDEAAMLPPVSEAVISKAVSSSSASSGSKAFKAAKIGAFFLRLIPSIVLAFAIPIAFVGSLIVGGVLPNKDTLHTESAIVVTDNIVGSVVFSGGDAGYEYINPKKAFPQLSSKVGEVTIHNWKITNNGGLVIICEGEGCDADAALADLSQNGEDGEYEIIFSLEDEAHDTYTLRHSFFIRKEKSSI